MANTDGQPMFKTNGFVRMTCGVQQWRGVGARRARSEPSLKSQASMTALPADEGRGIQAVSDGQSGSSSTRRLTRGLSNRVVKLNVQSDAVADAPLPIKRIAKRSANLASSGKGLVEMSSTFAMNLRQADFLSSANVATDAISGIRCSVQKFGTESVEEAPPPPELEAEELLEDRLEMYKYVRKIEPRIPALSLEPLFPDLDLKAGTGDKSMMVRNMDPDALRRFSPDLKRLLQAELAQLRAHKQSLARDRRIKDEEQQVEKLLAKLAQHEERVAQKDKEHKIEQEAKKKSKQSSGHEEKMQSQRKFVVSLAMIGFVQRCRAITERYADVKHDFEELLTNVNKTHRDTLMGVNSLAKAMCLIVTKDVFAEAMRAKLLAHRNRPQLVSPKKAGANEDGRKSVRAAPGGTLALADIAVELPSEEKVVRLLSTSERMYAMLRGRIQLNRRRLQARLLANVLNKCKSAVPLVVMLQMAKRVRMLQRFWRRSVRHMLSVRAKVDAEWVRLERALVPPEYVAPRIPAGQLKKTMRRVTKAVIQRSKSKVNGLGATLTSDHVVYGITCKSLRDEVLISELRRRREEIIPAVGVWRSDLLSYERERAELAEQRRRSPNWELQIVLPLTEPPECPSYLPTEEELLAIVKHEREQRISSAKKCQQTARPAAIAQKGRQSPGSPTATQLDQDAENVYAEVHAFMLPPVYTPWSCS